MLANHRKKLLQTQRFVKGKCYVLSSANQNLRAEITQEESISF